MIWQINYYVIIVPSITFVATIVGAAGFITAQHKVNVHTSIFSTTVTQWTEAWLANSLVTTGICTILIIYKLLSVQRNLGQSAAFNSSRSLTTRVLRIFIESAALYSINNLLYAVLYSAKISEEAWFSGLDAPVASITFSLIIIRVESAVNSPPTTYRAKTRTIGGSSGSNGDGSFYPSFGANNRGAQKPYPALLTTDTSALENGFNEVPLKTMSSGHSETNDRFDDRGSFNPYPKTINNGQALNLTPGQNQLRDRDQSEQGWSNRATAPDSPA